MNSTSLPNFSLLRSLLTGFIFLFCQFSQAQNQPSADLDDYIRRVLNAFDVPGVSVAIVKDGKVVSAQGYGVRKLGEATPVDAKTLFGIASNTKAFTATALGILVEERK